jgi:hypothetical protein
VERYRTSSEASLTPQGVCRFKSRSYRHELGPIPSERDMPSGLARSTRAATATLCASSFVSERMNPMMPSIKQIVKDNIARFSFYRTGNMFYTVDVEGQK